MDKKPIQGYLGRNISPKSYRFSSWRDQQGKVIPDPTKKKNDCNSKKDGQNDSNRRNRWPN